MNDEKKHPNLSWSEAEMPQKARTKHVHGLHPYMGKYVPQLVEYFLKTYFKPGDIVLDPFVGSGTTIIEANTMGIEAIGIDISAFNILLCTVKAIDYDFKLLNKEIIDITSKLNAFVKQIREKSKEISEFFPISKKKEQIEQNQQFSDYIANWYTEESRRELLYFKELIPDYEYQDTLRIILSRSARSARLAPHFELDWPKEPVTEPYYCRKHSRICYPTSGAYQFIKRYGKDTIRRLKEFTKLKTKAKMSFIHGDSRSLDFRKKITGIMTSPPYVGIIDYHQQHQYAYEFFALENLKEKEIGSKSKGTSKAARKEYAKGIEQVLINCTKQMKNEQCAIIFVVNDKDNLYEKITSNVGLQIEERITREVNRRSGRRAGEYFEDILIMRKEI